MNKRLGLVLFRLAFGSLGFITILTQLIYLDHHKALNTLNFFSYFTILSNVFSVLALLIGAFYLLRRRKLTSTDNLLRNCVVLYMAVTGIIYATLLSGLSLGLLLPWVNDVLHRLMPIVIVVDWLYEPSKIKLKQIPLLFVFPIIFVVYTLIRGPIVHWYPYPFLNPTLPGGYGRVLLYCVGILVLFFVLSWLMAYSSRKLKRHIG